MVKNDIKETPKKLAEKKTVTKKEETKHIKIISLTLKDKHILLI